MRQSTAPRPFMASTRWEVAMPRKASISAGAGRGWPRWMVSTGWLSIMAVPLWNGYQQANAHGQGLRMAVAEIEAITRLHVPADVPVPPRPEHEIQSGLRAEGVGCPAGAERVRPGGAHTRHELHRVGQSVRFLEQEVGVPFRLAVAEQGCDARFDFEYILDGRGLDRQAGAKSGAALQIGFAGAADFQNG